MIQLMMAAALAALPNVEKVSADFGGKPGRVVHYAVDPMSERPYLPDAYPVDGQAGEPVRIVAANGEYEPGSFLLYAFEDMGKVKLEVGDLRSKEGKTFPKEKLDLKTVKVWYQASTAWFSYFADPTPKLCPELLLNDEDLIKVDTAKTSNYARLTHKDGKVSYFWLNAPRGTNDRCDDMKGFYNYGRDPLVCMRPEFADTPVHAGATLAKGAFKQFFLTANVTKDTAPGIYQGKVEIKAAGGKQLASVPVVLRVLPFELPAPACYFDVEKPFLTWFCDDCGYERIMEENGNDAELSRKQLKSIALGQLQHGQEIPCYGVAPGSVGYEIAKEVGQKPELAPWGGCKRDSLCVMRADAKRLRRIADRLFGKDSRPMLGWGDEYGLGTLRQVRPMIETYQNEGFRFSVNSRAGYIAGGNIADIYWPPVAPARESSGQTAKFNDLGGAGYFGWYANQHVAAENPAFNRRQNGFGPYRAGFSCNYNYETGFKFWNDTASETYRPMRLYYGCGSGVIACIQWEGFREGLDDIRYATLLKKLALPLVDSRDIQARYEARLALKLLADADGDDMDLTALRLNMVEHILKLMKFGK